MKLDENVVLDRIYAVWKKYPELRLCQLLCNATQVKDLYYVEDIDLLDDLEGYDQDMQEKRDKLDI